MFRTALPGVAAAIVVVAAIGATVVIASLAPNAASAGHYNHAQASKPAYAKGAILKHCLGNQGECTLVVN